MIRRSFLKLLPLFAGVPLVSRLLSNENAARVGDHRITDRLVGHWKLDGSDVDLKPSHDPMFFWNGEPVFVDQFSVGSEPLTISGYFESVPNDPKFTIQ